MANRPKTQECEVKSYKLGATKAKTVYSKRYLNDLVGTLMKTLADKLHHKLSCLCVLDLINDGKEERGKGREIR